MWKNIKSIYVYVIVDYMRDDYNKLYLYIGIIRMYV